MPIVIVDLDRLARNWWLVELRGIAGVVFGLCTFLAPEISLAVLVLLFGAYTLADGVFAIVSAFRGRGAGEPPWLWRMLLLEGVVDVGVGVITFVWPDITALALLYLIAAWAVLTGCLEIAAAIRLRKLIPYEWLLGLTGALSIGLGILLALFPGPGALALVLWVGAYALVTGGLLIALGLRLRSWNRILRVQATDAAA
jgi:uncharacterized membrane protein HdeD (DUF308 family)